MIQHQLSSEVGYLRYSVQWQIASNTGTVHSFIFLVFQMYRYCFYDDNNTMYILACRILSISVQLYLLFTSQHETRWVIHTCVYLYAKALQQMLLVPVYVSGSLSLWCWPATTAARSCMVLLRIHKATPDHSQRQKCQGIHPLLPASFLVANDTGTEHPSSSTLEPGNIAVRPVAFLRGHHRNEIWLTVGAVT